MKERRAGRERTHHPAAHPRGQRPRLDGRPHDVAQGARRDRGRRRPDDRHGRRVFIGASNYTAERLREALETGAARALASGFLTGKYRGMANPQEGARGGAVKGYLNDFGYGVLAALDSVAEELSATPAQVALAWLASQPAVAAPIASATRVAQVEELLGAMRLTLTSQQLLSLAKASRPVT